MYLGCAQQLGISNLDNRNEVGIMSFIDAKGNCIVLQKDGHHEYSDDLFSGKDWIDPETRSQPCYHAFERVVQDSNDEDYFTGRQPKVVESSGFVVPWSTEHCSDVPEDQRITAKKISGECSRLGIEECVEAKQCHLVWAARRSIKWGCDLPLKPVGCTEKSDCGGAFVKYLDTDGICWSFNEQCAPTREEFQTILANLSNTRVKLRGSCPENRDFRFPFPCHEVLYEESLRDDNEDRLPDILYDVPPDQHDWFDYDLNGKPDLIELFSLPGRHDDAWYRYQLYDDNLDGIHNLFENLSTNPADWFDGNDNGIPDVIEVYCPLSPRNECIYNDVEAIVHRLEPYAPDLRTALRHPRRWRDCDGDGNLDIFQYLMQSKRHWPPSYGDCSVDVSDITLPDGFRYPPTTGTTNGK